MLVAGECCVIVGDIWSATVDNAHMCGIKRNVEKKMKIASLPKNTLDIPHFW